MRTSSVEPVRIESMKLYTKTFLALIVVAAASFTLASCGSQENNNIVKTKDSHKIFFGPSPACEEEKFYFHVEKDNELVVFCESKILILQRDDRCDPSVFSCEQFTKREDIKHSDLSAVFDSHKSSQSTRGNNNDRLLVYLNLRASDGRWTFEMPSTDFHHSFVPRILAAFHAICGNRLQEYACNAEPLRQNL